MINIEKSKSHDENVSVEALEPCKSIGADGIDRIIRNCVADGVFLKVV